MRSFLKKIEVLEVEKEVNPYLEVPKILAQQKNTVLFKKVKNSAFPLVGNICNSREKFALALGVQTDKLIIKTSEAINHPSKPNIVEKGACQEVVEEKADLSKLPIPTHTSGDMGPYITSGVFIASDPKYGQNISFHRAAPISKSKLVARICQRHLYEFLERANGELDVAICIGLHPAILLSAAVSPDIGFNELEIANSLKEIDLVKCKTNEILIPAETEIVLEGKFTGERHKEGPFPDITRTMDIVREEPVIEIEKITRRKNALYHTILPALEEHQLLMGMPKEPLIYNKVSSVCKCIDVLLTPGGCGWLHGLVQIKKNKPGDGKKAIQAAFEAHRSLKHLVIVDEDIDIHNSQAVEWALATRFQGSKDMITWEDKGSSLDPSADKDRMTTKIGFDATKPSDREGKYFREIKLGR